MHQLAKLGVENPDEEWGRYAFLRPWDERKFLSSLAKAQAAPKNQLKADGNRAIMLCSTTDAYQLFRDPDPKIQKHLNDTARWTVRRSLELIRDQSDLRVRILTRSPLARQDFDIYRSFGDRLLFGVSLPTLNDALLRIYEPGAPGAAVRLDTLQRAAKAGLNVFVAMAPTPPECDRADYRRTLIEFSKLNALSIFHEPINIRAENVARIERHAESLGVTIRSEVLRDRVNWTSYAICALWDVAEEATKLGLGEVIHPWPDKVLQSKAALKMLEPDEQVRWNRFFHDAWARVSVWPGQPSHRINSISVPPSSNMSNSKKPATSAPATKELLKLQSVLRLLRPIKDIAQYINVPVESVLALVQAQDPNAIIGSEVDAPLWIARAVRANLVPVVEAAIDGVSMLTRFQYREEITPRIVDEYAELYKHGAEPVPPIMLWTDPTAQKVLLIIDGFHRLHACAKIGRQNVTAVVINCPAEIASMLPVRQNETHGMRYGVSEKRRALKALFLSEPKLAKELRENRKGKSITQDAIGALYGVKKATVNRALDDAQVQAELEFERESPMEYLEYDLGLSLLQARMEYLFKEKTLPVSLGHLDDLAAIHVRLENLLCRLLDVKVRSLRKELEQISKRRSEQATGIEVSASYP